MKKKVDILSIKLADLNFGKLRLRAAVKWLLQQIFPGKFEVDKLSDESIVEWAAKLVVADVINTNKGLMGWETASAWLIDFRDKVISLGMTQLDWIALSSQTVTSEMLKSLGKEELKKRSAILLNTHSGMIIKFLADYSGRSIEEITIGELLDLSEMDWLRCGKNFWYCASKTRKKLREIGFSYEDGIFLQEGTRREFVERIMKREGLNLNQARMVVDIAKKYGWIKKTHDWDTAQ